MVEFYFSALNFTLAQTIALLTSPIITVRGTIRIPVPVEIFQTMFFSRSGKFGFNYSDKLFTLFNLSRAEMDRDNFKNDVFSYNVEQSGAVVDSSEVTNRTAWETAFNSSAAAILSNLDAKCQSFDVVNGTDTELVLQNNFKFFPSGSNKNLAEIVANELDILPTTDISYIPLSIGDKIVFEINVTLTGTTNNGSPIPGLTYRVEMVAENMNSPLPINSSVLAQMFPSNIYGQIDSSSCLVEYNSTGTTCSINDIYLSSIASYDALVAHYDKFGIFIQLYDNKLLITKVNTDPRHIMVQPTQNSILGNVIVFSYMSYSRYLSFIQTNKTNALQPLPKLRSNDVNYSEYVPSMQQIFQDQRVFLYSVNKRYFYVNDAGDTMSDAYTYFNFLENKPISANVLVEYDHPYMFTNAAPVTNVQMFTFGISGNTLPTSAVDTTPNSFTYTIVDATGTTIVRSFPLDNAQCTNFFDLKSHIIVKLNVHNELYIASSTTIFFAIQPLNDLITITTANITCLLDPSVSTVPYFRYHNHYRVISQVPKGDTWNVVENDAFSPFMNNTYMVPPGTYTLSDIAGLVQSNVLGCTCYVFEGKYLVFEKLAPFSLFGDILKVNYAQIFGFFSNRTYLSSQWSQPPL